MNPHMVARLLPELMLAVLICVMLYGISRDIRKAKQAARSAALAEACEAITSWKAMVERNVEDYAPGTALRLQAEARIYAYGRAASIVASIPADRL